MSPASPVVSAKILDGVALARRIEDGLTQEILRLKSRGVAPKLVCVCVGDNQVSWIYLHKQQEICRKIGIDHRIETLPAATTQAALIDKVESLNRDPSVTGIMVQLPLPGHIHAREVQLRIALNKDVEGIHPANVGRIMYGDPLIVTTTALAAWELFLTAGIKIKGQEVVVVGHSEIVGKPLALLLLASPTESATLTVCHIATQDLAGHTRRADVLFTAVGKPNLITADMIKPGAVVIDVGINTVPIIGTDGRPVIGTDGRPRMKIVGDVDFEAAKERCAYISPVPGGVGPLTVAMLMKNTVACAAYALEAGQRSSRS